MNKKEIVQEVLENSDLSKKDVTFVVNEVIKIINDSLSQGDSVKVDGLGTFETITVKGRKARNPRTGEQIIVEPSKKVVFIDPDESIRFKPVPALSREVNAYKYQ